MELQKYVVYLVLKSNLDEERQQATLYIWAWADTAEEAEQKAKDLLTRETILGSDDKAWEIEWVEAKNGKL